MIKKQDASNAFIRALLTVAGVNRDFEVLGILPGDLSNNKLRPKLLSEFDGRCAYCDIELADQQMNIDHVVPINKTSAGLHMYGNLVPSCRPCNSAKKNLSLIQFATAYPERVKPGTVERLEARAARYGADLDTTALRKFAESLYAQVSELVDDRVTDVLRLLPNPTPQVEVTAREIKSKADFDFSEIAKLFPLGAHVRAALDGKSGLVVDYSLQGPKGKRSPYVTFQETPDSPRIRRSPHQLEVIRLR